MHGWGCACLGVMHGQSGLCMAKGVSCRGHALPGGMHGREGVCAQGDVRAWGEHGQGHELPGMHPLAPHPRHHEIRLRNARPVCIVLECIVVE